MLKSTLQKKVSPHFLLNFCIQNQFPIAFSKLPSNDYFDVIFSEVILTHLDEYSLFEKSGFAVSPFNSNENAQISIIENKYHYRYNLINSNSEVIKAYEFNEPDFDSNFKVQQNEKIDLYSENNYIQSVSQSILKINNSDIKKVVLARTLHRDLPKNFDLFDSFLKICKRYPNAFNSLVSTMEYGTWIGSSPEILISVDEDNIFKTVSLAGTKVVTDSDSITSDAQWSQKEIHEQALVSRFIVDCFKKIRVREYDETGPKTIKAGSLWHLKSEFEVNLKNINFENLPSVMLKLLNPTSAVCGMPKANALELINKFENFDRQLYSGFIGNVNISNQSHLYVNLRCAQIKNRKIIFYAGAGITEDSVPENEYLETIQKMKVLENVLFDFLG